MAALLWRSILALAVFAATWLGLLGTSTAAAAERTSVRFDALVSVAQATGRAPVSSALADATTDADSEVVNRFERGERVERVEGASEGDRDRDVDLLDRATQHSHRAPLCDPRGASAFAPPPQMQNVEVTIDTAFTFEECVDAISASPDARHTAPGQAPVLVETGSSSDAALFPSTLVVFESDRDTMPVPRASATPARPGFRSTLDRPPRL